MRIIACERLLAVAITLLACRAAPLPAQEGRCAISIAAACRSGASRHAARAPRAFGSRDEVARGEAWAVDDTVVLVRGFDERRDPALVIASADTWRGVRRDAWRGCKWGALVGAVAAGTVCAADRSCRQDGDASGAIFESAVFGGAAGAAFGAAVGAIIGAVRRSE